ncbi:hypothetical protein TcasGA2_TC007866 [Tribolium castaneum]|uniref:Uncharacterized protein n=1 Tax=Tribolium castaneum TaxID=7070 RepID=D2A2J4_TRICA|nr:hypothetical protein TcasGA2_TC007866 [Tribolium castaneum]
MRNGWGLNVRTMIVVAANHEGKMEGCRYVINTFVDLSGLGLRYIVRCLLGFRLFHAIRTPLIKDFIVITTILHQLMASTCLISDWRY